ncbi:hypothetical protein VCRA2120E331_70037 [Vibrio crassostreae]|nr:hypothetical protein VCRA2120E331_70037 [Vibrio crassostreae]CAK3605336.1 hypothetical protein VCRA2127O345_70037 [Vibrio crassostreae]CAK3638770.1 hypothetical protein VCRA2120E330_80126 [Vibrio crassostreae]CAK3639309.1 hypothetical protein VCRA2122O338_70037 [Vibrio crassostreae]CAK3701136.1 hypothetical protein VCRA2122O340_70039 [Vibrio crassostreae]
MVKSQQIQAGITLLWMRAELEVKTSKHLLELARTITRIKS